MGHLWLRAETKPFEKRTPLTPQHASALIAQGVNITVERSPDRIFPDADYEQAECSLTEGGSWRDAPLTAYILGTKELPREKIPLRHKHIYFAHVYKGQPLAQEVLGRFREGGGVIYDLEYLTNSEGQRVVSFGFWSGVAGAALALICWCLKEDQKNVAIPLFYSDETTARADIKRRLAENGKNPKVLIIGAKGRCGTGTTTFLKKVGMECTLWDREETEGLGPFPKILDYDIMFNCVSIEKSTKPFLTPELLHDNRNLSLIVDISCDCSRFYNLLPIYEGQTNFKEPCKRIVNGEHPLDIIAIDNMPSFFPMEASLSFSEQLYPLLLQLHNAEVADTPWARSEALFSQHIS